MKKPFKILVVTYSYEPIADTGKFCNTNVIKRFSVNLVDNEFNKN